MNDLFDQLPPRIQDLLDPTSGTRSRIGHTAERVMKMHKARVSKGTIAKQLTDNSPNHLEYTEADVDTLLKVGLDCKTKVIITAAQAKALINDARSNQLSDEDAQGDTVLA